MRMQAAGWVSWHGQRRGAGVWVRAVHQALGEDWENNAVIHLLIMPTYKPGDPAPTGYLQWHEWAAVQWKAGLRQRECGECERFYFPQELSDRVIAWEGKTARGVLVRQEMAVCKGCAEAATIASEIAP